MTFKVTTAVTLLALALSLAVEQAHAQIGTSRKEQIHLSLLKCYEQMGKTAEQGQEYAVLLAMRPQDGALHYNYGHLLQTLGNKKGALAQFKAAAQYSPGNVDIQGTYGQMLLYAGDYQGAYNKLGAAMQMAGGERYKAGFTAAQQYLQQQQQQRLINQQNAPGPASKGPGAKKHTDEDDE